MWSFNNCQLLWGYKSETQRWLTNLRTKWYQTKQLSEVAIIQLRHISGAYMEYLQSTMDTPVFHISISWKWLGINKYCEIMLSLSHVALWTKMQFAIFEIKDIQQNEVECIFFIFRIKATALEVSIIIMNLWKYSLYSITRYWHYAKVTTVFLTMINLSAKKRNTCDIQGAVSCHLVC